MPTSSLQLKFTSILDLGFWSYTTVVADVTGPFDAVVADAESIEVRWVPVDEVATLPLHPGFESSWPELRAELLRPVVLIVDSANVVGSRPNGWWKDRLGATKTFAAHLAARSALGFTGDSLGIGLPGTRWWPEVTLIVEGQARGAAGAEGGTASAASGSSEPAVASRPGTDAHEVGAEVRIVAAERDGDQAIVDAARSQFETTGIPPRVFVVTADRELSERVSAFGAGVHGPGWLWALLDELDDLDAAE